LHHGRESQSSFVEIDAQKNCRTQNVCEAEWKTEDRDTRDAHGSSIETLVATRHQE
jgi:hypothetical protein